MAKIGLILMAGGLSLCPAFNTEGVSAQDLSTVPELKEQWRTDIRTERDVHFGDAGKYALRPIIAGELMSFCRKVVSNEVYSNGYPQECWEVVLLDRRSGEMQWESPTAKTLSGSVMLFPLYPPVVGEGQVYLITTDGAGGAGLSGTEGPKIRLNAYNCKTGAYLWERKLGRLGYDFQVCVKEDGAGIFVAMGSSHDWTLYSCDRATGKVLWEKTGRWSNRPNTQAVDLSPAFVKIHTDQGGWAALKRQGGEVVLALDSHVQRGDKIYSAEGGTINARLESSLDSLWQVETGIESNSWKPVPGKDELLWFQAVPNNFVGVTLEGKVAARMDLEAQAKIDQLKEPWVQDGMLYGLSKDQKRIYALRPAAGEVVWQWAPTEKKGPKISATILDGRFALASWEGGMACLETSGGRELWRRDNKRYPLLDKEEKEMLWSVEPDQISGLNLQDGKPVWTIALPGDNTPIEVKGRLLAAFNYLKAEKMLQMVFLDRHHGNALGRLVLDLVPVGTLIEGDMLYFWNKEKLVACSLAGISE